MTISLTTGGHDLPPLDYGGPPAKGRRIDHLRRKVARRDATIARLSERVELPLCAADLAVAASIPLPIARRVWRALRGAR